VQHPDALRKRQLQRRRQVLQRLERVLLVDHFQLSCCDADGT